MDCSLPGSSVHGISQARILEWVAISSSRRPSATQGSNLCLLYCRQSLYHWATWEAHLVCLCLDINTPKHVVEKEMATHSSVLAWRILWMEEPGGLLSIGSHRVEHDGSYLACMHVLEKEMATHSSILAWRIPGTGEPGGLLSMGLHKAGHD